jgi:periplasmic nitrate reductase NapE
MKEASMDDPGPGRSKALELRSFLFLAVVMAPVMAGIFVAGFGFVVWMLQVVAGPPGA